MTTEIEEICDNQEVEYKGDVIVKGNIGKNARLKITDGSLTVYGNIKSNARIILAPKTKAQIQTSRFLVQNNYYYTVSTNSTNIPTLEVIGNIENQVNINTTNARIIVQGSIGNHFYFNTLSGDVRVGSLGDNSVIKTKSGDVRIGNLSDNSVIKTMSGDIETDTVGTHCSMHTMSGDIRTGNIGSNTYAETMSGNLILGSADKSVKFKTMSGDIIVNGIRQRKEKISVGGVYSSSNLNFCMLASGVVFTTVGIAAVAIAFTVLNAATFGVAGLVVAGIGLAAILSGIGLSLGSCNNSCTSQGYSSHILMNY